MTIIMIMRSSLDHMARKYGHVTSSGGRVAMDLGCYQVGDEKEDEKTEDDADIAPEVGVAIAKGGDQPVVSAYIGLSGSPAQHGTNKCLTD